MHPFSIHYLKHLLTSISHVQAVPLYLLPLLIPKAKATRENIVR